MADYTDIKKIVVGKTQWIRAFDVLVLAPVMMYSGMKKKSLPRHIRAFMFLSGVGTAVYNAYNFYRQSKLNQAAGIGPFDSLVMSNAHSRLEGGPFPKDIRYEC